MTDFFHVLYHAKTVLRILFTKSDVINSVPHNDTASSRFPHKEGKKIPSLDHVK